MRILIAISIGILAFSGYGKPKLSTKGLEGFETSSNRDPRNALAGSSSLRTFGDARRVAA